MPADLRSLMQLEVPVIVQVAERSMTLEQVLSLAPGSIVQLSKSADKELDILVGTKPIGFGRAVKVGENFGVRITHVGDVRGQIDALDGTRPETKDASEPAENVGRGKPAPAHAEEG